jgi:hypothetical protein
MCGVPYTTLLQALEDFRLNPDAIRRSSTGEAGPGPAGDAAIRAADRAAALRVVRPPRLFPPPATSSTRIRTLVLKYNGIL